MKPFWIVWSPTGPYSPRVTHEKPELAIRAATAMAAMHPGQSFYVMEGRAVARKQDVTLTVADGFEVPIPF